MTQPHLIVIDHNTYKDFGGRCVKCNFPNYDYQVLKINGLCADCDPIKRNIVIAHQKPTTPKNLMATDDLSIIELVSDDHHQDLEKEVERAEVIVEER